MKVNRRSFIGLSAASAFALGAPTVLGAARPRVVVVGGGAGGATVARTLAAQSAGAVDVVLVEPTRTYYTCFFSNLYLGGFRDFASLGHSYGTLASGYGINVVHDWAVGVDRDAREVHLASGPKIGYDRLVLSPGIDFVDGAVPGWDVGQQNRMPHAYKAGSQTQLLKAQ
ncbi:MAG: FAD-dependent oxidoreductase, partial [Pseudomonadota bacterium]